MNITMPMNERERKEKIAKIVKHDKPSRTGEPLLGSGRHNVYSIPLEALTYNRENTRFMAETLTYRARNGIELDVEKPEHYKKIEKFIWNWKKDRNESTIKSLLTDGQQRPGVITDNGIVISGNRRLRMMNEIVRNIDKYSSQASREILSSLKNFEAIVLEEKDLSRERIFELESFYQFAEDPKSDYNPVQKYLRVNEQFNNGASIESLAKHFAVTSPEIKKWIGVCDLMNEYLEVEGIEGYYTSLENLEDPFLGLYARVKTLANFNSSTVNWAYQEVDIEQLKQIYFDFMFGDIYKKEKQYRELLNLFNNEKAWKKFVSEVNGVMDNNPMPQTTGGSQVDETLTPEQKINKKKSEFHTKYRDDLRNTLDSAIYTAEAESQINKPMVLIGKTKDTVSALSDAVKQIKQTGNTLASKDEIKSSVEHLINELNKLIQEL